MSLGIPHPKNTINLVAGLIGIVFDRLAGPVVAEVAPVEEDDLTMIGGIGPTFARRLNEAGIHSFADLAAMTPSDIRDIAKVTGGQFDPADWIAQANSLV